MVKLKVNGMDRSFDGDPDMPLLWYVRDILGLTGTKFGCGIALCGACTVHKNGEAIRSCVTPMSAAAGSDIRTIEDLGANGLHPLQEAWMQVNVPQCGYCQSGQIMQAVSLLKSNPIPRIRKLTTPWRATSAAVEPTSEFVRRSSWRRGRSHESNRECEPSEIPQRSLWGGSAYPRGSVHPADARCMDTPTGGQTDADRATFHPNLFVGIQQDGTVYIVAHRSEMGTTIRTSLPLVLADELDADWKRVKIDQAIGDKRYGDQNTDGSQSIRRFYDTMRECGAAARWMLIQAAAQQWNVPASECSTELHTVVHKATGRRAGYGELASEAARITVPKKEQLQLKEPSEWRYIGKGMTSVDLEKLCTGKAMYGMDARIDGMVYASIEHPPVFGGKIKSLDDQEALKVAGVHQTVSIDPFKPPAAFQPWVALR